MKLSATSLKGNQTLDATVTVTNTSAIKGKEVVQLYIRDVVGSITRPVQELKGFEKIELAPGDSKVITFKITPELLKFYDSNLVFNWEAGDFDIMIGTNSKDVQTKRINWSK
jgi:beta-glucosidase